MEDFFFMPKGIVICRPFLFTLLKNPPQAMALFPFILVQNEQLAKNKTLLNHERIHLRQEIELLILPFYILYLLNYFSNLIKYKNHYQAYKNICFEREAYMQETNMDYLKNRNFWAWTRYIRQS
jgi:hypothetical protein